MGLLTRGEMVKFGEQATALHNLYLFVGQMHKRAGCEAAAVIAEVCWGSRKPVMLWDVGTVKANNKC